MCIRDRLNAGIRIILIYDTNGVLLVLHRLEQGVVGAEIRDDATDFIFTIGVALSLIHIYETNECTLPDSCGTCHDGKGSRPEIIGESVQDAGAV